MSIVHYIFYVYDYILLCICVVPALLYFFVWYGYRHIHFIIYLCLPFYNYIIMVLLCMLGERKHFAVVLYRRKIIFILNGKIEICITHA